MGARLVAGACAVALAGMGAGGREVAQDARPVVVRIAMPLPVGTGHGHASFVSSLGDTRWSLTAVCSGGDEHARLSVVIVAEPLGAL